MLGVLIDKEDNMQEYIGNVSREMGNFRKESKDMLEIKNTVAERHIRKISCTFSSFPSTPPFPQNLFRVNSREASIRAVEEGIHSNHTKQSLVLLTWTRKLCIRTPTVPTPPALCLH